jgi:hypothetical protein
MGLTWAAGGAFLGFLMELVDPNGDIVDIWPAAIAYPAFLGGLAFSAVLGIAARHRRFDELSLPRFAVSGAVGGLLVSLVPAALVALGLASTTVPVWRITAMLVGPFTLGSAIAASGSLALARIAEKRESLEAGAEVAELGPVEDEERELRGPRG